MSLIWKIESTKTLQLISYLLKDYMLKNILHAFLLKLIKDKNDYFHIFNPVLKVFGREVRGKKKKVSILEREIFADIIISPYRED